MLVDSLTLMATVLLSPILCQVCSPIWCCTIIKPCLHGKCREEESELCWQTAWPSWPSPCLPVCVKCAMEFLLYCQMCTWS